MKPTFRIHFSDEHPKWPGLWVSLRNNLISVLQVDQSDFDRDKREGNWLDGQWGACLERVDRDLVPLDRRKLQEYLDPLISKANQAAKEDLCSALQTLRIAILGEYLQLPKAYTEQDEPKPLDPALFRGAPDSD